MPRKPQPRPSLSLHEVVERRNIDAIGTWRDETSLMRGPDGERSITGSRFQISQRETASIHGHIHYPVGTWLLSCSALNVRERVLDSKDLTEAKKETLELLRQMSLDLHHSLQERES